MFKQKFFYVLAIVAMVLTSLTSCEKDDDLGELVSPEKIKWNLNFSLDEGSNENPNFPRYRVSLILWSPVSIDEIEIETEVQRELSWGNGKQGIYHYLLNAKDFELTNVPYSEKYPIKGYYVYYYNSQYISQNPVYEYGELTEEKNIFSVNGYIIHNGIKYYLEDEEYTPQT